MRWLFWKYVISIFKFLSASKQTECGIKLFAFFQSLDFDLIVYAPYRSIEGFIDDMEVSSVWTFHDIQHCKSIVYYIILWLRWLMPFLFILWRIFVGQVMVHTNGWRSYFSLTLLPYCLRTHWFNAYCVSLFWYV